MVARGRVIIFQISDDAIYFGGNLPFDGTARLLRANSIGPKSVNAVLRWQGLHFGQLPDDFGLLGPQSGDHTRCHDIWQPFNVAAGLANAASLLYFRLFARKFGLRGA